MLASEAAAVESSSRAHQDADAEPEPPKRRWVALVSTPVIFDDEDERGRAMAHSTDVELDLHDPPQPSYLVLPPHMVTLDLNRGYFTRKPSAYILAADRSGRLLLRVTDPRTNDLDDDDDTYLCNTHTRRATSVPAVPYDCLGVEARPHRSLGLIADPDPRRRGHYLVAQLYPRNSVFHGDRLLCYSTATLQWFMKPLTSSAPARMGNPYAETAVLAHAGRLYWVALPYGVFFCDPFAATAHLRFVPLPADCVMREELTQIHRGYVTQRRRVAPSEGLLRYVEIRGLSYEVYVAPDVAPPPVNPSVWMWTLVDPEAAEPWRFEYAVTFAEVWAHESYVDAGLPQGEVPHVALVDPDDHGVVYFLQGSKLFSLDVLSRRVVSCEECSVRDDRAIMLQSSRPIIDAWELSPPSPPRTEPSSPSPPPELDPDIAELMEKKDRWVVQYVDSWLETFVPTSQTDEGPPSSSG